MNHAKCYIPNYPRPQFVRESWLNLDGKWNFIFDNANLGEKQGFNKGFNGDYDINVPFTYECKASGINVQDMVQNVWYSKNFTLSEKQLKERAVINFEGVDFVSKVWVNGTFVGEHVGAYSRFSFDITNAVCAGENLIVVKAEDGFDVSQPRGKQRWQNYNYGCWYEQTTGIWKSVWIEFTPKQGWLNGVKITPNVADYSFDCEMDFCRAKDGFWEFEAQLFFEGKLIQKNSVSMGYDVGKMKIYCESPVIDNQVYFWSPNDPKVYDFVFYLKKDGKIVDEVKSYAGLREFKINGSCIKLNGFPYYQKLVLYQGYWQDTGLTVPDEQSIVKDIELIKEMGYNGVRVHQLVEDERWLYYADIMGLINWCEMPSNHIFNERGKRYVVNEWNDIIAQNYNHTSIVTWVVYNESWGARQIADDVAEQRFADSMVLLTKSYDLMRPVISNDGWEHTASDVITVHNYEQNAQVLYDIYKDFDKASKDLVPSIGQRAPLVNNYTYANKPVLFSEYGGCAFSEDAVDGWGYGDSVKGEEDFLNRFDELVTAIKKFDYCAGYCYTQFTDVQQEKNGLLTIDRKPKVSLKRLKEINERR